MADRSETAFDTFCAEIAAQLPKGVLREVAPRYQSEPRDFFTGRASLLLAPSKTDEVALILRAANRHRVGIVPYGGGTGLVGGQIADGRSARVLLSLERMNRVRHIDAVANVVEAEAGVVLASLKEAARAERRLFALSLASEGSCQIGGVLSTNAGGVNVIRYGNARALCLGLEAVLPDGRVLNGLSPLVKDNTGFDLRDLLIGAEGSLGIITAATLRLHPEPQRHVTALLGITGPDAAVRLLSRLREHVGESISAFELISRQGLEFISETMPHFRLPMDKPPAWLVLVELGFLGSSQQGTSAPGDDTPETAAFEAFVAEGFDKGLIVDGLVAQNESQRQEFWSMRETIPEANRKIGAIYSHDISVPVAAIPEMIARGAGRIAEIGDLRINAFGHVGDGNIHYNIYPPKGARRDDYMTLRPRVNEAVYGLVHELGGSISAEHGIGRLKLDDLRRYADPAKLAVMRAIKAAMDPNGILNPGATVP